jgi:RNA polymerase sigma factor (sigma-70 family)
MLARENTWECMLEGNKNAFLTIYQQNYNILFGYGFSLTRDKELTKDCIQEMFLEIWNTRTSINKNVQNIRAYFCTWLRRKISRTQSRIIKQRTFENTFGNLYTHELSYEELLIAFQDTEEKKAKLNCALNKLTKKQLEIINLKFFENLSYAEIAEKTQLSSRTVYNTIYLAIQRLREGVRITQHA